MAALIEITAPQLDALVRRVERAAHADLGQLLELVGEQQVSAAQTRISRTKKSPSGARWAPWSPRYAQTRGTQHSLLVGEGSLRDSLTQQRDGRAAVLVGSTMEYAAAHLYGYPQRGLRARPFLDTDGGFADPEDRAELRGLVEDWISEELGG